MCKKNVQKLVLVELVLVKTGNGEREWGKEVFKE